MAFKRLLVVDDDAEICRLIQDAAEERGFDVVTTDQWAEFQTACDEFQPTVIIIDVVMPDVDGITLVRELAARKSTARIVVISGFGERYIRNAVQIGSALGLEDIRALAKPFSHDALCAVLED